MNSATQVLRPGRRPEAAPQPVICLAAPFPPTVGGMAIQAEKLADRLSGTGVSLIRLDSFPAPPRLFRFTSGLRGVRTMVRAVQYLRFARRAVRQATVVHHFVGSQVSFFLQTTPLLLVGRYYGKPVILNHRSGSIADGLLRHWGWLAVRIMRLADSVVTPSPYLQRALARDGIEAAIIPNIADTELFPFRERRRFRPRLLVARQLEWVYDIPCVLRAFAIVQARYADAELGVAGPGSQESQLRALADELNLRNVTFYGQVANQQMPALYALYDIAVNASVIDNFPGAILEAALSGLALVSTGAGGIADMIRDGKTGLLVPLRDPGRLATAIADVLQRQDLAWQRTIAARKWAEQFSWERVFPLLRRYYGLPDATNYAVRQADGSDRTVNTASVAAAN